MARNAPRRRRSAWPRRLTGVVAFAAIAVAVAAGVQAAHDYVVGDDVVLEVDTAFSDRPPSTIPLDATSVDRESPRSITIDGIDLDGPVRPVGIEDDGELEVPDESEVGWYQYGSAPGLPGSTVLAAHVSWNGVTGLFHRLGSVEPGALVDVELDDGSVRTYEVTERTMYPKDSLPIDRIWRTTGDETLVLITCGGDFNPDVRRYRHNIVLYAVPVAERGTGTPTPAGTST